MPSAAASKSRDGFYQAVPAEPEAFSYDLDGNLLQDGLWHYEWDADGARQRGDGAPGRDGRAPLGRTAR